MKAKDDELVAAEPVSGIPDRVLAQIKDIQVLSQNTVNCYSSYHTYMYM